MKCHGNDEGKQGGHNHSPLKHMLHMAICCGLPILIISFLPLISKFSPRVGGVLAVIAPFICPIIMLPMMINMFKGNKGANCCDDKNKIKEPNKTIEE